jgi:hypothetical protein
MSAFARYRCSSNPSIPGIRTSRIRHLVSSTRLELRNSPADVKATALKPKAPTRYRVESAIEASSSTMQTRGVTDGLAFSDTSRLGWYPSQELTLSPNSVPVLLDLGLKCRWFWSTVIIRLSTNHSSWLNERLGSQVGVAGNNLDHRRRMPILGSAFQFMLPVQT